MLFMVRLDELGSLPVLRQGTQYTASPVERALVTLNLGQDKLHVTMVEVLGRAEVDYSAQKINGGGLYVRQSRLTPNNHGVVCEERSSHSIIPLETIVEYTTLRA